jgi:hypothetical protein
MTRRVRAATVAAGKAATRPAGVRPTPRQIQEDLLVELFALFRLALKKLGARGATPERAFARSRKLKVAPRVSGPMLRDSNGLANALLEWSREAPYLDANGKPKVLPIRGPGITFEALTRRHMPTVSLKDALKIAYSSADVTSRPGGKIALIGGIMVKINKSDNLYLAHATRQIGQLLQTLVHNRQLTGKEVRDGRMERIVTGIIARGEYPEFMQELRPQFYDILEKVDSAMEHHRPKTARALKTATAVSVGLFVSQEDDWARVGLDTAAVVPGPSKRKRLS